MALPKMSLTARKRANSLSEAERLALVRRVWGNETPSDVARSADLDFRSILAWRKNFEAEARHLLKSGRDARSIAKAYKVEPAKVESWARFRRKSPKSARPAPPRGVVVVVLPGGPLTVAALTRAVKRALAQSGRPLRKKSRKKT